MKNEEVASLLNEIADILEIQGETFKPRAYRRAAENIENLGEAIEDVHGRGELKKIPGIGEGIAKKIGEFLDTGGLGYLDGLKEEVPAGVLDMLGIQGLGPKKVALLFKELNITTINELKKACGAHELAGIKGLGAKTQENILKGIALLESTKGRFLLDHARRNGEAIKHYLEGLRTVKTIELAGSLRRSKETIGDIDILVVSDGPKEVMEAFTSYEDVSDVIAKGETKSSIRLRDGMQADVRVVPQDAFGAAMQYFTGSKAHNVKVRKVAISKGLKINEYGVFPKDSEEKIAGKDEEEVYEALGLAYIPPELREDRGEVELAQKGELPALVTRVDIKGDLHVHSDWSDGVVSISDLVAEAKKMDYKYLAVCDHSQAMKFAGGLSKDRLLQQVEEIGNINKVEKKFLVFAGIECNINTNGSLDIRPDVEDEVDFITGAIHSNFNMSEKDMTRRIVSALGNERMKVLAHPTGRLLGRREAYKVNMDKIIDAALENQVFLEINSFPDRLDLNDTNIKHAKERGARFAISTDTHRKEHLAFLEFGVATARRGWLEKKDVVNTLPTKELVKLLKG
ncbi:MAG: DNA polymerase/3'-5' exonuclease PolX [Thermoplasmata archaeon]|nr:MAG: DNA polymerase/3'-5' exonuclease PolX [Thermoplasmata archaeon]